MIHKNTQLGSMMMMMMMCHLFSLMMMMMIKSSFSSIPSNVYPPLCSLKDSSQGFVLNVTDGVNPRCASVITPPTRGNHPVLFVFHGAGGNAKNFGGLKDSAGKSWSDVSSDLSKSGFAIVGGEATQFSGSSPSPIPQDCLECFDSCREDKMNCSSCCSQKQMDCASVCGPERVPFRDVEKAVCSSSIEEIEEFQWHGGEWLIPDIQTDMTGIKCEAEDSREITYINNILEELEKREEFDMSRIFVTGCSMGSAMTLWISQCLHLRNASTITSFATQSTGLKVKGDGLTFPPDNYNNGTSTWGECDGCEYFPAPVVKSENLKACIVDQTGDNDFYKSSLNLNKTWIETGMRAEISISDGGHCQTHSFEWIANCLDDGTGRLLGE